MPLPPSCLFTSILFLSVAAHAYYVASRYVKTPLAYAYAVSWLLLSITSIMVHGFDKCKKIDKIMVYTVVALGFVMYVLAMRAVGKRASLLLASIPIVTFMVCIILYYLLSDIDHVWVHVASMVGHHAILALFWVNQIT